MGISTGPTYYLFSYLKNIVVVGHVDVWIGQLTNRALALSNNAFRGIEPPGTPVEKWGQGGEWEKEAEE
jgi:hypothetical protein